MTKTLILPLLAVLLLGACDDDSEAGPTAGTTQEPEAQPPAATGDPEQDQPEVSPTGMLMREHFTKAREARAALIGGDIETARAAMGWLAANDPGVGEIPEALRPSLTGMREKAGAFAEAATLTDAGLAYAAMLTHCGECHGALERGPTFAIPPLPEGDELRSHMQRHRWAADRMWEGLVTHDTERFGSAAEVLSEVALHQEALPTGEVPAERIHALAQHVHELGPEAAAAETDEARADIYGRFLATCATCHRALGVGQVAQQATQ